MNTAPQENASGTTRMSATGIAYGRSGAGAPLVLLHGLGNSMGIWEPILDKLAGFDAVIVDLPGFGRSRPLPGATPTAVHLAEAVARLLDELGLPSAHLVGNSLGGWVALELAIRGRARSLTLLSPAGLWPRRTPAATVAELRAMRWLTHRHPRISRVLLTWPATRSLILALSNGHPGKVSAAEALAAADDLRSAPGFEATLAATARQRFRGGEHLAVPVTVAFGTRDRILRQGSRRLDALPPQTRLLEPTGWGHLPVVDDPTGVARMVRATVAAAESFPVWSQRPAEVAKV